MTLVQDFTDLFAGEELVCFTEKDKDKDNDWKICLSDSEVHHAVKYFHLLLNHPGKQRLLQGTNKYFHPDLRKKSLIILSVMLAKSTK